MDGEVGEGIRAERASLGDGAWSWFADPRAVRFSGDHRRTYVGWTSQNGDIKVAAYDHDSLIRTTARVGNERRDDHNNPAIQILPDRRVRVYWSFHGGTELWYRTSLAPEDITAWGPLERVGTTTAGEHGYTYPNPVTSAPRAGPTCSGEAGTGTPPSRARPTARRAGRPRPTSSSSMVSVRTLRWRPTASTGSPSPTPTGTPPSSRT